MVGRIAEHDASFLRRGEGHECVQWVKSRLVVICVAGVYEVNSEVSSHVIRIMTLTIIRLAITT
jgi:hypothetical protein